MLPFLFSRAPTPPHPVEHSPTVFPCTPFPACLFSGGVFPPPHVRCCQAYRSFCRTGTPLSRFGFRLSGLGGNTWFDFSFFLSARQVLRVAVLTLAASYVVPFCRASPAPSSFVWFPPHRVDLFFFSPVGGVSKVSGLPFPLTPPTLRSFYTNDLSFPPLP